MQGEHCYGSCGVKSLDLEIQLETLPVGNEFYYGISYAKLCCFICCLVVDDTPMYKSGLDVNAPAFVPIQVCIVDDFCRFL